METETSNAGSRYKLASELRDALTSSLDLQQLAELTRPLLLRLFSADHVALALTNNDDVRRLDWMVSPSMQKFFDSYEELAPHDFVYSAVVHAPQTVLRDAEIVPRAELERNLMHQRARELGMPLEQVMAVMLHSAADWGSGLALYRENRRPFSDHDRQALQELTPALANAVRNCRDYQLQVQRGVLLERVLACEDVAGIVLARPFRELTRTAAANVLLDKWFGIAERQRGQLPVALVQWASRWNTPAGRGHGDWLMRADAETELWVRPRPLMGGSTDYLLLVLYERQLAVSKPTSWETRLTAREHAVASRVLRGWDNQLIADELGCQLNTIKKHLTNIFTKLGVSTRAQLMASARSRTS